MLPMTPRITFWETRLMILKALFAAGATAALLLALPANAAELTIGFSQIGSESGWRAAETSVSKQEATNRKVNLKIADAQQKQENQIKAIRSFIAQGVDAIFLAPVVSTGWDAVLKEAKEAKIPVVLLDRDIDPSGKELYLTAVTSDSVHEGAVAGQWLAKTVGEKSCNIVELTPSMAGPALDASSAFKEKGTVPPKWIQTESKLYTAADDPQKVYDSKKGLGY